MVRVSSREPSPKVYTGRFATICNTSSGDSDAPVWPLWVVGTCGAIDTQIKKIKNQCLVANFFDDGLGNSSKGQGAK